jgi:UDP-glucose 4-epimerase
VSVFAGRHVLVVGGAGFVGANLVRELCAAGAAGVLVIDNLLSSERGNLSDHRALTFVEGSIADDAVLAGLGEHLDYVFHLATYHGNQSSIADPLADHEHNLLTTLRLFDRLKGMPDLRRVVYSSAGCTVAEKTFDDAEATTEDGPVSLWHDSPYQISKLVGEMYANYYFHRHGLPAVKARFQNVYGPGEILGAGRWRGTPSTVWRNVVPTFVHLALHNRPLPVENGGVATRDFIYVEDVVRGLMLCAEAAAGSVYNLASGRETSIFELAETINDLTGNDAGIELAPARDWDRSGRRYGSTVKASAELGFEARVPLRDGLARTVAWTRENRALIDECISRHVAHMAIP